MSRTLNTYSVTFGLEYMTLGTTIMAMNDLDMVCPDCGAEAGEACHPDCSTFWTEEE